MGQCHDKHPLISWSHAQELRIIPADFPKQLQERQQMDKSQWKARKNHSRCIGSVKQHHSSPSYQVSPPPSPPPQSLEPDVLHTYISKTLNDVLRKKEGLKSGDSLKKMSGPPMKIHIKDNAQPYAIHTARRIPVAYEQDVKQELEELVAQDIITSTGDTPSEWCHPMVVVPKPKGGVRITVDMTKLNMQVARPTHPALTPQDAIRQIDRKAKYFTTFVAIHGYWQIPLDEEDQHLTTFITPQGIFKFRRGPMGLCSTGDEYNRRGDEALAGIPNLVKVADDILLWDEDYDDHLLHITEVLNRCREHGITLNAGKMNLAAKNVSFCGYTIAHNGMAAADEKVKAIAEFPTPSNITDLRSFMGLVNQLAEFTPNISQSAEVLRPLMSPRNTFI